MSRNALLRGIDTGFQFGGSTVDSTWTYHSGIKRTLSPWYSSTGTPYVHTVQVQDVIIKGRSRLVRPCRMNGGRTSDKIHQSSHPHARLVVKEKY